MMTPAAHQDQNIQEDPYKSLSKNPDEKPKKGSESRLSIKTEKTDVTPHKDKRYTMDVLGGSNTTPMNFKSHNREDNEIYF